MPLEIIIETSTSPEIEVDVENTGSIEVEVDVIYTGPSGLASVIDQNNNLIAELEPGETYTATAFDTLKQKILGSVPLTVTQKILD